MRTLLLACAATLAAAVSAVPAQAQGLAGQGFTVHRGIDRDHGDRGDRDRRRNRRAEQVVVLDSFGYYDDRYNGRAFAPDSYNDWWHDNPSRSYPRWMQNNGNCQRVWWSGGGWTC